MAVNKPPLPNIITGRLNKLMVKSVRATRKTGVGAERQDDFAIPLRMQCESMVVGVAQCIVERVPPTRQTEQVEEQLVQPSGTKHRAMAELVYRRSGQEAAEGAVYEQGHGEGEPQAARPQEVAHHTCGQHQGEVAAGLEPTLPIAAPHQLP